MKKLLLPLMLVAGFAFTANAQSKTAQAQQISATLVNDLELDEGTYIRVKQAYVDHFAKVNELETTFASDKNAMAEALRKEQIEFDSRMQTIMNERQFSLYQANVKR